MALLLILESHENSLNGRQITPYEALIVVIFM